MATAPVKSQPLHNFALPFLGWGGGSGSKNQAATSQRCRRPPLLADSPSAAATTTNHSEPDSESDTNRIGRLGSRTARNRLTTFASCSVAEKSQKQLAVSESNEKYETEGGGEAEEMVQKPWNLRPRKGPSLPRAPIEIGGAKYGEVRETVSTVIAMPAFRQSENLSMDQPKSMRLRGFAESVGVEKKKEKRKFWISLSKEEIEEDIFVMTGSRPARRPRKRPKNVQKQLDNVFPGLWLVGFSADAYRIAESLAKR